MKSFEIFSQPARSVGKPNHPVNWVMFFGTAVRALCLVWIGSRTSKLRINHRLIFSIPDSMRKVLKSFEIFSQPAGLVGKSNQSVH